MILGNQVSKRGFTLLELLVYMGIVGIIVVIAGEAFSNSTKFRVRTDNMIKATQEAENIGMLIANDIAQMGAKSSLESVNAEGVGEFIDAGISSKVYMNVSVGTPESNLDSSSYSLSIGTDKDELKFRRFRYTSDGVYEAVEEIDLFVENNILKRSCRTIEGTEVDGCANEASGAAKRHAVVMAEGVTKFKIIPAHPGVVSTGEKPQMFPPCVMGTCSEEFRMVSRGGGLDANDNNNYNLLAIELDGANHKFVRLSNFVTNYNRAEEQIVEDGRMVNQVFAVENAEGSNLWANRCKQSANSFTFEPHVEYEISFKVSDGGTDDFMRTFVPGRDHMAVGFRDKDGARPAAISDFLFYPPGANSANSKRTMRFTVPQRVTNVCMAFTFASFSPISSYGTVVIEDLKLKRVETSNYSFDYAGTGVSPNLPIQDKERVRAFKLELQITRGKKETGEVKVVIPTPSNGVMD